MTTTVTDIPRPRFAPMYLDRFGFAAQRFEPSIPHILGRARRA
jgi:hypothetical protein